MLVSVIEFSLFKTIHFDCLKKPMVLGYTQIKVIEEIVLYTVNEAAKFAYTTGETSLSQKWSFYSRPNNRI